VDIDSSIPVGSGMGSSAALSVAIARATAALLKCPLDAAGQRRLSMRCERRAHGRPSGVDTEVCVTGRPVWAAGGRFEALDGPGLGRVGLLAMLCGVGGATADMIARVDRFRASHPRRFEQLAEQTVQRCHAARQALLSGEVERLGPDLTRQHEVLHEIGVSTPALDAAVQSALAAGASGAKLSGAGGGGLAVAVAPVADLARIADTLRTGGISVLAVSPLAEGRAGS
jgi:mevalonate kinase